MNTMTPEQALQTLAQAAAEFRGTRKDHEVLETAVRTLAALLPKPEEKKD